jgi:beta-glucosidase
MIEEMAHTAAVEARTAGVNWFYSPMVDIARDPRWGRCTEGAGEDPYLGSRVAQAYIRGYQGKSLADPTSVAASVKHFAAYGAAEAGRDYNSTDMSDQTLRQVYLPPYHAAVQSGAATIMSAFNSLNGTPASANPYLMQTILRKEWGFDGPVVSDYTAVMELTRHGIATDAAMATQRALTSGVDIDMQAHFYDAELPALIQSGKVPMSVVDEAVRRVLRVKFALGLFDHPFTQGPEVTGAVEEHRAIARRAAEESFVLLQNHPVNGTPLLPLATSAHSIALIGPLADDANDMVGAWSGANNFGDVRTLRQTLTQVAQQNGQQLTFAKGTDISGSSDAGFAEAVQAAQQSDVVVLALGESSDMSGEASSRAHLELPGNQQKLLETVQATGKPVVLLIFSGRPLVLTWAAEHVASIMQVWFPGVETGPAITNVLYGKTAPSGKLTMTFPRAVGQIPLYYNHLPTGRPLQLKDPAHPDAYVEAKYVSRYLDESNDPLFAFGHGLTYTTFAYKAVTLSRPTISAASLTQRKTAQPIMAEATVTNTGTREATEIVQCYVNASGTTISMPVKSLQGFTRVTLKPGESRKVQFPLGFAELSFYNASSQQVVEPAQYTVYIGGDSNTQLSVPLAVTP